MLFDREFWFNNLASGRNRLQFELECTKGTDPERGHTGFFIPGFTAEEVGNGALSKSVDVSLVAEKDRIEFKGERVPVEAVSWRDAIVWTIRQIVLDVAAITTISKFLITAAFSDEGCVMPGWSSYTEDEKAAINWR